MLNRRTLRIKIMQSLFAFEQCKEADYQLALEQIEEYFQPDLNSMKVQDKDLLKSQRKIARPLLEKKFDDPHTPDSDDKAVNAAVKNALAGYQKNVKKDFNFLCQNLVQDVEKINTRYYSLLGLLLAFADAAAHDKKVNHENFIANAWIKALAEHAELRSNLVRHNANWQQQQDKIRQWFRDIIKNDEAFRKFNELKSPDHEEERAIIKHLVRNVILGKSAIHDFFEEDDIRWVEDKEIVKSLVGKTIKSLDADSQAIALQKLSLDWEDDREFMEKLYADTVSLDVRYKEFIAKNTKNWEVDRLPLTDRIILEMAIAELISFPNIPVKVTINEYIELAKLYGTPNSRQFINGILDVIAKELQSLGSIKKSGRGLIDNK
jgi:N utilization substance protein B